MRNKCRKNYIHNSQSFSPLRNMKGKAKFEANKIKKELNENQYGE